jgi:hypothetical protein
MKGIGKDSTRERFGRLTKLCMNPAKPLFVEEHATTIVSMRKPPTRTSKPTAPFLNDGLSRRNTFSLSPSLREDPFSLDVGDLNLMLLAAPTTVVTIPILQHGQV